MGNAFIAVICCAAGLALQRLKVAAIPVEFTGEGQMLLNSLQVVEVLADDSNFRQTAMEKLAEPLAHALSLPPADFASACLAGRLHPAAAACLDGQQKSASSYGCS